MIEIEEGYSLFLKILIPSLAAISVTLAVQIKNGKTNIINACLSIIIGVASAYLSGGLIFKYCSEEWSTIAIALVTITGEKIAFWLIYKFNIDGFMEVFYESLRNWIAKK